VFRDKSAAEIALFLEIFFFAIVKSELQGANMGSESTSGTIALATNPASAVNARVDVVSDVAVGQRKIHRLAAGQIIRRQIVAEFIALNFTVVHGVPVTGLNSNPTGCAAGGELTRFLPSRSQMVTAARIGGSLSIDGCCRSRQRSEHVCHRSDCEVRYRDRHRVDQEAFPASPTRCEVFGSYLKRHQTRHVADVDVVVVKGDTERPASTVAKQSAL